MTATYKTTGSKYEATKDLDITEIAKLVRKDIKNLFSNFPSVKISVRVERYSMGQSLHVKADNTGLVERSTEARAVEANMKTLVNQYNFDDSDHMSDYYHVRFHSNVRVES